jgi:serine/threonine protein kinase/tetratricopeptide (TPR) repeat protein
VTDSAVPPGESTVTEFRAPQGLLRIGERFGRYEVIRQLGSGGMGHVYEAWDRELHEAVALKVIRREVANDPDADARFKNELTLARHITHKNVVRIHDLGQVDGVTFISMAMVDGVDLSAMFKRERLPRDRALSIARQLCEGLAAAHEAGVVHRDLKPSNVMVDRAGRVYLLDFGLARSIETAQLTQVGTVVGTVDYFAPEQAMGGPADHRSDIYALGLILYELFTGVRPFRGETAMIRLSERLHKPAPDARTAAPEVPASIARVIGRCLERSASGRYQSVTEILADLTAGPARGEQWAFRRLERRTVALAIVAVVISGAVGGYLWRRNSKPSVSAARVQTPVVSLAILPFRNASGEHELEWLGSAVSEMIRAEIGQSSSLRIVSSSRVSGILGDLRVSQDVTFDRSMARRIADFSNAELVISGEYSRFYARSGSVIRFDVIVDGTDRATFTAEAPREADVPQAVRALVDAFRAKVPLPGTAPTDTLAAMPEPIAVSMLALKAYTEGLELARQGNDVEAIDRFKAATEADPHFALAFANLAESYARAGSNGEAVRMARQAAALSASLPLRQRYRVEGISARVLNDADRQLQAATNLVNVSPADSEALYDLADLHERAGRFAQARDALGKVLERDPKYTEALRAMARVEIRRGNPEAAFDPLNRALAVTKSTENLESKANLFQAIGIAYKQIQKPDEALRCYQQSLEIKQKLGLKRGIAASLGEIGQVQAMRGNFPEAEQAFRDALRLLRELDDKAALSSVLVNFGSLLNEDVGRPDEGLPLLREALQIRRETGNTSGEALVLNNLGAYYQSKGQFDQAQTHFELALKIREKTGAPRDVADTVHNLAEALVQRGQYDQSRAHYVRALELRRTAKDKRGEAIESYSIGHILDYQGRSASALKYKGDALALYRDLKRRDTWLAEILGGVGQSLVLTGRTADAVKYLDEAMGLARELGNQDLIAALTASQADCLYYNGDVKGAYNLAEAAVRAAGSSKNRAIVLRARAIRAKADASLRPGQDSASRLGTLSREADALGLKAVAVECSVHRAEVFSKIGDRARARQEAEHALEQAEMFGLRLSLAKAHLVHAGTVRERDGDCAAASRILDAIRGEPGSEHVLKRFDLTELSAACSR